MQTKVHIINHTHWDREWFLTSVYTSQWIPGLIDKLEQLTGDNPDYRYLLDGQTLVIEDLLKLSPDYEDTIKRLAANGNLLIGPYYCQPDWQIVDGESLIRNLLYGWRDMERYGGENRVGWLVDTFGHISQAPQLHRLFGLEAVFVWRGVPRLEPYFHWQGADDQCLLAVNLFGGYRNLYGITHAPELAVKRLEAETAKLRPFYPTDDIPLFDGYDLEQNPEDPARFYRLRQSAIPEEIEIQESSPGDFVEAISRTFQARAARLDLPVIVGELNSGKYGATFPGTLSTRTYLKVMNWDCEHLLYRFCEPLAVLARLHGRAYPTRQYEAWGRALLQNTVHDCICGVSVDQVHEKMEVSYLQLFQALTADIQTSLAYILRDFAPGLYAIGVNPFPYRGWRAVRDQFHYLETDGIGVWRIMHSAPIEEPNQSVDTFEWRNEHYTATVGTGGAVQMGRARVGFFVVSEERGDAYSTEVGRRRSACTPSTPLIIEQRSDYHCVVRYDCILHWDHAHISATVRLIFDQSPLLRWQVELDSRGSNFKVDMVFETALSGEIYAGMPFDVVKRPAVDRDLLPRRLDDELATILLGQRELEQVDAFPFHDFVAVSDGASSAVVFAKGLRSYQAEQDGTISLTLRRAVEWVTASDLEYRAGDAGPFMYVPDARCERTVKHEVAVMIAETGFGDLKIDELNASFQTPPLIAASGGQGKRRDWQFLQENIPLSSLTLHQDKLLARFYNPTDAECLLEREYLKTDVWGNPVMAIDAAPAKSILTVEIAKALPPIDDVEQIAHVVTLPEWRVGDNQGMPDEGVIRLLETKIGQLEAQLQAVEMQLVNASGNRRYVLQHRYYVLKRELYELKLSVLLNRRKLAVRNRLDRKSLYTSDPEIAELGAQLNQLRIERRIYDYVMGAL